MPGIFPVLSAEGNQLLSAEGNIVYCGSGFVVEIEFSSGVWTNVDQDVLSRDPIRFKRGVFGSGPLDLIARPGTLSLSLNNTASNSAGLIGYYSPNHANVRSGFAHGIGIRLRIVPDSGIGRYFWRGRIRKIDPTPNTVGSGETYVTAEDWIGDFEDFDDLELTLLEDATTDEMITALVDLMPVGPAVRDFDTGIGESPFAFDDFGGSRQSGIAVAQDVAQSEPAMLYLKGDAVHGETLKYEALRDRVIAAVDDTFLEGELKWNEGIVVPSSTDRIINDVEIRTFPRSEDAAATTVLVAVESFTIVPPGETVTVSVDYSDPDSEGELIGGNDIVTLAEGTDYTANSNHLGTGIDMDADVTVAHVAYGSHVEVSFTNAASYHAHILGPSGADGFQVRGKGLRRYSPVKSKDKTSASITSYGRQSIDFDMPYEADPEVAKGLIAYILMLHDSLTNVPTRCRVLTENVSILARAVALDIGSKIVLSESMTAVSSEPVFIHAIEGEIFNNTCKLWWTLAPADTTNVLIFDDATKGLFDTGLFGYL